MNENNGAVKHYKRDVVDGKNCWIEVGGSATSSPDSFGSPELAYSSTEDVSDDFEVILFEKPVVSQTLAELQSYALLHSNTVCSILMNKVDNKFIASDYCTKFINYVANTCSVVMQCDVLLNVVKLHVPSIPALLEEVDGLLMEFVEDFEMDGKNGDFEQNEDFVDNSVEDSSGQVSFNASSGFPHDSHFDYHFRGYGNYTAG